MNDTNACPAQVEKLTAYVLQELTPEEAAVVEQHIAACAGCADEVLALHATVKQLRVMPVVAVLEGERRTRLLSEARAAVAPRRRVARFPLYATAATLLILVSAGLVVTVMQMTGRSPEQAKGVADYRETVMLPGVKFYSPSVPAKSAPAALPAPAAPAPDRGLNARIGQQEIPLGTKLVNDRYPANAAINDAIGVGGGAAGEYVKGWGRSPAKPQDARAATVSRLRMEKIPEGGQPMSAPEARTLEEHGVSGGGDRAGPESFDYAAAPPERQVEEILRSLAPRPGETPDMMFFRYWGDNPCVEAGAQPLSTFSVDVDTASYTLARNYLSRGNVPPKEAVRTEEFVNYFRGGYPAPKDAGLAIYTELSPTPFAHEPAFRLLRIGVKAREIAADKRLPCALVFVIDCSGSMQREDRLELVKQSLRLLVSRLDERDTIGIVAFQTTAREVLQPVGVQNAERILQAIESLGAGGSTNAGDGLLLGYEMASRHFLGNGTNRVILCSDGVANTGVVDPDAILSRVRESRERKVFLTSIGVGMGNHNDALLERLADAGDGQCLYVDRLEEARKIFTEKLLGTLQTVAKDAKIQVAFDPARVVLYRQLGYENRALAAQDFRNDAVDAGEIGAGHEVTALYEVMPLAGFTGRIATVTVRYKPVAGSVVKDAVECVAEVAVDRAYGSFENASPWLRLDAVAAEFAEILRQSYWARGSSLARLRTYADPLPAAFPGDKDVAELVALLAQTERLQLQPPAADEVAQTIDALKENRILAARLARLQTEEDVRVLDDLKRQNETLERKIVELLQRRMQK